MVAASDFMLGGSVATTGEPVMARSWPPARRPCRAAGEARLRALGDEGDRGEPGARDQRLERRGLDASMGACRSRTNADDRLPRASLGRVEGGDGIVEGRDVADVRPQSSVPHPLDDLTQLGTIGLDNEVD